MIEIIATITVVLAMVTIMGMVLVPATPTHSRLRRTDQRTALAHWFAKYFGAPRTRSTRRTGSSWWSGPIQGL